MINALIFGRAKGVWAEMKAARELGHFDCVIGVGSAAVDYPGQLDHWVSFHASVFPEWANARARKGYPAAGNYWSSNWRGSQPAKISPLYKVRLIQQQGGSSGLIATMVALDGLGAQHVVLAGIPMDPDEGQYDTKQAWKEALVHREVWVRQVNRLLGRVRSMSGWTQQLLGAPNTLWLQESDDRLAV